MLLGLVLAAAALLAVLVVGVAGAAPATAAASPSASPSAADPSASAGDGAAASGLSINVRVRTGDGEDVPGATVQLLQGGQQVATAETDDRGTAALAAPSPGDYQVKLDVASLPSAAKGLEPRSDTIATTVQEGLGRTVAFRLSEPGSDEAAGGASSSQVLQRIATGLRFGLVIALGAIGLSLIFGTTGLTNFAHSELITLGALTTYLYTAVAGLPFLLAAALGLVSCAVFGYLNDRVLWQPLRRRGTGLIAMMIVSIGLSLFLRYFYLYLFGGGVRTFPGYAGQAGVQVLPGVLLRPLDLWTMGLSVVVLVVVALALVKTRLGKATRAVADNPALASASGIDVDRVIRTVWIVGSALAGLSGVVLGLQQGISFQMGFQILLLVFAAVTLGGLGTAFGAVLGSLIVGLFVEISTLVIPTELQNLGALVILILILLVRPQGILGRAQRIG
ncbi:branched-chain amino acid ABC transporter permease [Quadrisphaera setariae]|uniref:branched-chain amino acid ABC transporter permease n=1 Tax=Quadrisphaera setariae TaxID=2593304 RepID=UPI001C9D3571|nr:branched-chain amino acid ABC transporter permease [Quadrisphaera setariae]